MHAHSIKYTLTPRVMSAGVFLNSLARIGIAGTKMLELSGENRAAIEPRSATSHFVRVPNAEYCTAFMLVMLGERERGMNVEDGVGENSVGLN